MNNEEKSYQLKFCDQYFGKGNWDQEVLSHVDVLLKGRHGQNLLYIEFKHRLGSLQNHRRALAQAILTNKKQQHILDRVALAYQTDDGRDALEIIDCSENSVMFNNDINWEAETPSNPSQDAVDRICDRIKGKITPYYGDDIREVYRTLKSGEGTEIQITEHNFNVVYNQWKSTIRFKREERDEQELINLFLTDMLNGTKYELQVKTDVTEPTLFGPLIREGTNLGKYELEKVRGKIWIVYDEWIIHAIKNAEGYDTFWRKYKRPPEQQEYLKILEHSAELYTDSYRRDTGGEYTPTCFVELQNHLLAQHYRLDDFIVCDPCAGVGNLENQFGKDYKPYCYLSTLEQMDVDICRIKGFDNAMRFDYLKDDKQPQWKYRGEMLGIDQIAKREGRKLMVIMNPPYTRQKGHKDNLAIEFFNKVLKLNPQVIVFYYETKSFLGPEISNYINSGYKIVSHVFSNAKTTFKLREWPVSQVIFDKDNGEEIRQDNIKTERYELTKDGEFADMGTYVYNTARPNLYEELKKAIKDNQGGMLLGNVSYLNDVIKIGNGGEDRGSHVTTGNLKLCLLSKGLIFNTHHKYFELNSFVYRGTISEIPAELYNDAVMFSLFYKGLLFSNKGHRNFIMPFTADELGCGVNDLNVKYADDENNAEPGLFAGEEPLEHFDFREFMAQFSFSAEAKALYNATLQVFRFYHHSDAYQDKDWNDSFYDIANAIMRKDITTFKAINKADDRRITKTKTTKGTHGFGRNTVAAFVPEGSLPVFYDFFDKRDALAVKINQELLDSHLLLWKRENIF